MFPQHLNEETSTAFPMSPSLHFGSGFAVGTEVTMIPALYFFSDSYPSMV